MAKEKERVVEQLLHTPGSHNSNDGGVGSKGNECKECCLGPYDIIASEKDKSRTRKLLNDPRFQIRPLQQVASACAGAMITACFMTPLDVIKTRMQSQQTRSAKNFLYCNGLMDHLFSCGSTAPTTISTSLRPHFRGTMDALLQISRREGIAALWSGLGPTLVSALPSTVVYFVAYEQFKEKYKEIYLGYFPPPVPQELDQRAAEQKLPLVVPMLSGVTARICAVTFVSPIELVRTKMQSQRLSYGQVLQFVRNTIAIQGLTGLWRGLPPTILRDVPFSGIYWPAYEFLKARLGDRDEDTRFGMSFIAGVIAGSLAAIVTCPFDVIKTQKQIEFGERVIFSDSPTKELSKKSTFSRLTGIYRLYGLRGLFAGSVPRLCKVAPACAIMISTFEYSKMYFFHYNVHRHNEKLLMANPNAKLVKYDDID